MFQRTELMKNFSLVHDNRIVCLYNHIIITKELTKPRCFIREKRNMFRTYKHTENNINKAGFFKFYMLSVSLSVSFLGCFFFIFSLTRPNNRPIPMYRNSNLTPRLGGNKTEEIIQFIAQVKLGTKMEF